MYGKRLFEKPLKMSKLIFKHANYLVNSCYSTDFYKYSIEHPKF